MKKFIFLFLLILLPISVNAEVCDTDKITIESINLGEKSDTVDEMSEATISGKTVNLDLNFLNEGDTIKYKLVVKNDSNEDYELDNSNVSTDYFDYIISTDNNIIKSKTTKELLLTINYKKQIPSDKFSNGTFNDPKNLQISLKYNDLVINPNTGFKYLIFGLISLVLIVFTVLFIKNKKTKYLIICLLLLGPVGVNALCKTNILINANITVYDDEFVYTSSTNSYNVGDNVTSSSEILNKPFYVFDNFNHNFLIRHKINNEGIITASYVGFIKDNNIYYIQGGDNGSYYEQNKTELYKIFGEDNCTDLNTNFICTDTNSNLEVVIGDDGFTEAGDGNWTCDVDGFGSTSCMSW